MSKQCKVNKNIAFRVGFLLFLTYKAQKYLAERAFLTLECYSRIYTIKVRAREQYYYNAAEAEKKETDALLFREKELPLWEKENVNMRTTTKMRRAFLLLALLMVIVPSAFAQKKFGCYAVGFYNQENLFDTIHDAGKNDYDFLPNGSYHWNKMKYEHKLANMAKVLLEIGQDKLPGIGASVIGLSEVENDNVMRDLTNQPKMKERGFKYIHIEGPDKRGIDCALLYNPRFFTPEKSWLQPYIYENGDTTHATRGFLTVQGKLAGDDITFVVCHWPSRGAEGKFRDWGGKQVRHMTDSIMKADPDMRVVVMGDMNDDPDNTSMAKFLGAKKKMEDVGKHDFFNPWWTILRDKGQGTLSYKGGWNLFDQIVMSRNLLDVKKSKDYKHLTLHSWHIFRRDYLIQQEGKYKGSPLRTTAGGVWLDGYSDHLPTVTYFVKEL